MKKITLISFFFILFSLILVTFCGAEKIMAEGDLNDRVKYKIVNQGDDEAPDYTLYIDGNGAFTGLDTSGNTLSYQTREESIFAPYSDSIRKVEIGDGITEIGKYGLAFLTKLKVAVIPQSMVKIGSGAFQNCRELENIKVRNGSENQGFDLGYVESIANYAFESCLSLKKVVLSDSLKGALGKSTFANCRLLRTVTVPEGVTLIADDCFKNCVSLHYIYVKGAPDMGGNIFNGTPYAYVAGDKDELYGKVRDSSLRYGGKSPEEVPFYQDGDAVDSGSAGAGLYWQLKKNVEYTKDSPKYDLYIDGEGSEISFIDKWGNKTNFKTYKQSSVAPYFNGIINVYILCRAEKICGTFFMGMTSLRTVMLPNTVSSFEGAVFEHCGKLESIYIEGNMPEPGVFDLSNVKNISAYCFDGCASAERFIFSEDSEQETFGAETFKNCKGLTSFTVPAYITKIEKNAFLGCENLTEVIFDQDAAIDSRAFEGCRSLKSFRGFADSSAESYANEHSIEFLYPCTVALRMVGSKKLIKNVQVIAGKGLDNFEIDGKVCFLYKDPQGTIAYDMDEPIRDTTTLYALPIYRIMDISLRKGDKLGLKADFALSETEGNDIYRIVTAGALASKDRGTSKAELNLSMNYIFHKDFLSEGSEYICLPRSGKVFNFCATGFQDENGFIAERCGENIYFRGYLTLENKKNGSRYTFYTEMLHASLYEKALSDEDAPNELKSLEGCIREPLKKDEMLNIVEKIALGEVKTLLSGTPEIKDIGFFHRHLAEKYDAGGDVPALVRFDVGELFDLGLGRENELKTLASQIAEYSAAGGSILLYLRPCNPINSGSLGGRLADNEWEAVFTDNSPQKNAYLKELGKTGMLIQFLKEEGVCVYVSLMPEVANDYRWWCSPSEKGGDTAPVQQYYRDLWEMTVPYFEEDCSLDNIIWIFEGGEKSDEYSPGTGFADIYGTEFESSGGKTVLSEIRAVS